jgi:hypothetical protein
LQLNDKDLARMQAIPEQIQEAANGVTQPLDTFRADMNRYRTMVGRGGSGNAQAMKALSETLRTGKIVEPPVAPDQRSVVRAVLANLMENWRVVQRTPQRVEQTETTIQGLQDRGKELGDQVEQRGTMVKNAPPAAKKEMARDRRSLATQRRLIDRAATSARARLQKAPEQFESISKQVGGTTLRKTTSKR